MRRFARGIVPPGKRAAVLGLLAGVAAVGSVNLVVLDAEARQTMPVSHLAFPGALIQGDPMRVTGRPATRRDVGRVVLLEARPRSNARWNRVAKTRISRTGFQLSARSPLSGDRLQLRIRVEGKGKGRAWTSKVASSYLSKPQSGALRGPRFNLSKTDLESATKSAAGARIVARTRISRGDVVSVPPTSFASTGFLGVVTSARSNDGGTVAEVKKVSLAQVVPEGSMRIETDDRSAASSIRRAKAHLASENSERFPLLPCLGGTPGEGGTTKDMDVTVSEPFAADIDGTARWKRLPGREIPYAGYASVTMKVTSGALKLKTDAEFRGSCQFSTDLKGSLLNKFLPEMALKEITVKGVKLWGKTIPDLVVGVGISAPLTVSAESEIKLRNVIGGEYDGVAGPVALLRPSFSAAGSSVSWELSKLEALTDGELQFFAMLAYRLDVSDEHFYAQARVKDAAYAKIQRASVPGTPAECSLSADQEPGVDVVLDVGPAEISHTFELPQSNGFNDALARVTGGLSRVALWEVDFWRGRCPGGIGGGEPSPPSPPPPSSLGRWSTVASMNDERWGHVVAKLSDGRVFVAGGKKGGSPDRLTSAELYDPERNAWTRVAAMPEYRFLANAARLPGNRVLVTGGYTLSGDPNGVTFIYDADDNTWTTGPTNPYPGLFSDGRQPIYLNDGRIMFIPYSMTSTSGSNYSTTYDPASNTWQSALIQAPGSMRKAAELPDGRVLLIGGRGTRNAEITSFETFDPSTNTWTLRGNAGVPANHNQQLVLTSPSTLSVVGGTRDDNGTTTDAVWHFNTSLNSFSGGPSLPEPRNMHGSIVLQDGRAMIFGGNSGINWPQGSTLRSSLIYDAGSGAWRSVASEMPYVPMYPVPIRLNDGRVIVPGGYVPYSEDYITDRVLVFDPSP